MSSKTAYDHSLRLLVKRDYSRFKLRQKLLQKQFPEEEVEEAIQKLVDQNYLREEEYKRIRVKTLLLNGYSNDYILRRLEQEELELDDQFIEELRREYQLETKKILRELVHKRLRGKTIPEEFGAKTKLKNKTLNFLLSKGHTYQEINHLVDNFFNAQSNS